MRPVFPSKFNLGSGERDLTQGSAARNCQMRSRSRSPFSQARCGSARLTGAGAHGACVRPARARAAGSAREVSDPGPRLSALVIVLVMGADPASSFRDQCPYSCNCGRLSGPWDLCAGGPRLRGAAVLGRVTAASGDAAWLDSSATVAATGVAPWGLVPHPHSLGPMSAWKVRP